MTPSAIASPNLPTCKALSPAFRATLDDLIDPYGDGHAVARIVDRPKSAGLGPHLLHKTFVDQPQP